MDLYNKKKTNECFCSEFCSMSKNEGADAEGLCQSYNRSKISDAIMWFLNERTDERNFSEPSDISFCFGNSQSDVTTREVHPKSFKNFRYVDCGDDFVAVSDLINCFLGLSDKINSKSIYLCEIDASKDYLDAFFAVSKNAVFNPNSDQLHNMSFRKSDFLEDLILFGSESAKLYGMDTRNSRIKSYSFGFKNPFVLGALLRIVENIKVFNKSHADCSNVLLLSLKREMFVRSAERSFNRFIFADKMTHRVSLNRHNSLLTSWPYYELSSIEEIKPIRLLEKIVTFINNNINVELDEYKIDVAIIGHTESSGNECERELSDLMMGVLSWYKSFAIESGLKTKLHINIVNYVNKNDWPNNNYNRNLNFSYTNRFGLANCEIKLEDYSAAFAVSVYYLKKIIFEKDIIFLLDCPWLTSENLEIKRNSSLEYFCDEIQSYDTKNCELNEYSTKNPMCLDSPKYTPLKYLDTQYNRIMASATIDAGSIVRVLKDRVIKKLQKIVSEQSNRKELYIFLSENEGLEYSYISSYPLCRQELYEGKSFSIFQFCNYYPSILKCTNKDKRIFTIRLWSILKYTSIAYAYVDFKDVIKTCFEGIELRPEHYFEIYRNIYVILSVNQDMTNVDISIKIDSNLRKQFKTLLSEENFESVFDDLIKSVVSLVKELYCNIVFSTSKDFGNRAIRKAFSMNIYSCIQDVGDVMFWHKYRIAMLNDNCDIFKVSFFESNEIEYIDTVNYDKELFMDKRVYDLVLLSAERGNSFSSNLKSMLFSSEKTYGIENITKQVVQNIVEECDKIGTDAEKLKWNVIESLREMY